MTLEKRPYIICHMTTSINGKITGDYLDDSLSAVNDYYKIHRNYNVKAFLCGRVTMESSFTNGYYPDLSIYSNSYDRSDYVDSSHDFYAVSIDFNARLGWNDNHITDDDPGYNNAYIIEVLSENVSDEFLAYLREKKISYIFAGKDKLDLELMLFKLKSLFHIDCILLEGGGIINGSFINDDLVDELSLIIAPYIEYSNNTKELFYSDSHLLKKFELDSFEILEDSTLYLKYKKAGD